MIGRFWRGWTKGCDSAAYAALLTQSVLPELTQTEGCRGAYAFRRDTTAEETEFTVLMLFENVASVKKLAGADWERPVVPRDAQKLLSRYDARAVHCEMLAHVASGPAER
ncbi:MAG: antibiotic biosynthesis monooxygenase [Terriglobia bacterium]